MKLVSTTPFTMTQPVAELIWGQVLKDAEYFDQQDAARFEVLLGELGYTPDTGFMTSEFAALVERAKTSARSEVDHQVDFQYHRIGRD